MLNILLPMPFMLDWYSSKQKDNGRARETKWTRLSERSFSPLSYVRLIFVIPFICVFVSLFVHVRCMYNINNKYMYLIQRKRFSHFRYFFFTVSFLKQYYYIYNLYMYTQSQSQSLSDSYYIEWFTKCMWLISSAGMFNQWQNRQSQPKNRRRRIHLLMKMEMNWIQ